MLCKLVRNRFSKQVFSWGVNLKTLGYRLDSKQNPNLPTKLKDMTDGHMLKVVNGYHNCLLLSDKGEVYHQGIENPRKLNELFTKLDSKELAQSIVDVDCDQRAIVFLDKNGQVFELDEHKKVTQIVLPHQAKFVSTGLFASLAVLELPDGSQCIYAWGKSSSWNESSIFLKFGAVSTQPIELKDISQLIHSKNSKVKKIKLVRNSAVILLENGEVISWGNNQVGNIGFPRSELTRVDEYVFSPAEILKLNHLDVKIVDFDMSDNVLVLLTTEGKAYYCGFDNTLKLKEIKFFEGSKVKRIGASFNHFYLQNDKDNKWYSNKAFEGQELVKLYSELGLCQLEDGYFEGTKIEHISGKYANVFAF